MTNMTPQQCAGLKLRQLIRENYSTQEEFALDFGLEIRTVNRYINKGINKIDTIQELAEYFKIDFREFFNVTA